MTSPKCCRADSSSERSISFTAPENLGNQSFCVMHAIDLYHRAAYFSFWQCNSALKMGAIPDVRSRPSLLPRGGRM